MPSIVGWVPLLPAFGLPVLFFAGFVFALAQAARPAALVRLLGGQRTLCAPAPNPFHGSSDPRGPHYSDEGTASLHSALARDGKLDGDATLQVIQVLRMGHKSWPAHDFPLCVDTPVWGELVKQVRAALQMGPAGPPAGAA